MTLRSKMQKTATKLIGKHGDNVQNITVTRVDGADEFEQPTLTTVYVDVKAIVTGVNRWDVGDTILTGDLSVLVSGDNVIADVGNNMQIDGVSYRVIDRRDILAAGLKSAVKYFVRRG